MPLVTSKWAWGGEHSNSASNSFSAQYFPYSQGTPFPLVFGEIKDQQIKQIKVSEQTRTNDKEAKIVGTGTDLMWFAFLGKSDGPIYTVTGLSSEGKTLYSDTINTDASTVTSTKPVPYLGSVKKVKSNL
jgi:hypothetical protein